MYTAPAVGMSQGAPTGSATSRVYGRSAGGSTGLPILAGGSGGSSAIVASVFIDSSRMSPPGAAN